MSSQNNKMNLLTPDLLKYNIKTKDFEKEMEEFYKQAEDMM